MLNRRQLLAIGAAVTTGGSGLCSATASPTAPQLGRGLNIHNVFNWPETAQGRSEVVYVWPPFSTPRHRIEPWEMKRIRKIGFDFVRLTVDPAIFLASDESRRAELNDLLLDRLNALVEAGLNVIVDLHPVAQNPNFAPKEIVSSDNPAVFTSYCEFASKLAALLAALPQDRIAFEPINEPILNGQDLPRWQGMAERLHQVIRAAAADLPVVMTGAMWGHYKALLRLDCRPFRGSNLFYTFHYYDPHTFTHQGIDKEGERYVRGIQWPPREPQIAVETRSAELIDSDSKLQPVERENRHRITTKLIADYYRSTPSEGRIAADFNTLSAWAAENGIARDRILMGEFGMTRNGGAAIEDRLRWLQVVRTNAERLGFAWALWGYRGWGGMALADDSPSRNLDTEVLRALNLKSEKT
jgi:hypothetical protein